MRSGGKFVLTMALLSMVLTACGGGATNKGVSGTTAAQPAVSEPAKAPEPAKPAQQEITIRVGSSDRSSLKNLMLTMKSFGKEASVKVDLKEYDGGGKIAQGLTAGEVDMAVLQTEHVLRDTSGELRMVALLTKMPANVLAVDTKYKDQIKSVKDLVGKKVSVSSIGGGSHQLLLALLKRNNIDPSSLTILPNGQDVTALFKKGEVAAVVSIEPFVTQAVSNGVAYALVDTRKTDGVQGVYGVDSMGWIALATRKEFLDKHPQEVERMVAAVRQSLQKLATSSIDELVVDSPDYMYPNGDAKLYAVMLKDNLAAFVADGKITEKLLTPVWANMQANGAVPKDKSMPFDQVVAQAK